MNVEDLHRQAARLAGQIIEVDGMLVVLYEGDQRRLFLSSDRQSVAQIDIELPIAQSFTDLQQIVQPLAALQLVHRGEMIYPPYLYRFNVHLQAEVDAERPPMLSRIHRLTTPVPHIGKQTFSTGEDTFLYQADVRYHEAVADGEPRGEIHTRRAFALSDQVPDVGAVEVISSGANQFIRPNPETFFKLTGEWMHDGQHWLFKTDAVRASLVQVGPLRSLTTIWWPLDPIQAILWPHLPLRRGSQRVAQPGDITATVRPLQPGEAQKAGFRLDEAPLLVCQSVASVTFFDQRFLH